MNTPQTTPDERVSRLRARTLTEAKRKKKGPLFHAMARLAELDHDVLRYRKILSEPELQTIEYARGLRQGLVFGVALLMKYRHRTPGLTASEIYGALRPLVQANTFTDVKREPLPVAA